MKDEAGSERYRGKKREREESEYLILFSLFLVRLLPQADQMSRFSQGGYLSKALSFIPGPDNHPLSSSLRAYVWYQLSCIHIFVTHNLTMGICYKKCIVR